MALKGRVVHSLTGDPVHKVRQALSGPEDRTGETDAGGRLVFEALAPGTCRVLGQKPGFLPFYQDTAKRQSGRAALCCR